jgi:arsenate reductase
MQKILFLCTGNSCRSLIAEALANQLGEGRLYAESAGSNPAGYAHPKALAALKKHGVKAEGLFSKSWDVFEKQHFDYVITVCDSAASETCPVFAGGFRKLHWSLRDPAAAAGSEDAIMASFEDTFAALKSRIESELLVHA